MFMVLAMGFIAAAGIVALLCAGGAMCWQGLRGRLMDTHQHCRACDFDLSGHPRLPAQCPECGAGLLEYGAVGTARRVVDYRRLGLGLLVMSASALPVALAMWRPASPAAGQGVAAAAPMVAPMGGPVVRPVLSGEFGHAPSRRTQRSYPVPASRPLPPLPMNPADTERWRSPEDLLAMHERRRGLLEPLSSIYEPPAPEARLRFDSDFAGAEWRSPLQSSTLPASVGPRLDGRLLTPQPQNGNTSLLRPSRVQSDVPSLGQRITADRLDAIAAW